MPWSSNQSPSDADLLPANFSRFSAIDAGIYGKPSRKQRPMDCGHYRRAMARIEQQTASFGFIATDDCIAKKTEVYTILNNYTGMRSIRDGSLEAMKGFIIEEDF